jgi:hypothetical protein
MHPGTALAALVFADGFRIAAQQSGRHRGLIIVGKLHDGS